MRLLPLAPTAHPSAWTADAMGRRQERPLVSSPSPCRFCGCNAAGWQGAFFLNGNRGDERPENVVSACALCRLCQRLGTLSIDDEAVVIWLPEMSQAALNCVARRIHHGLIAEGEPPHMSRRPQADTPRLRALYSAFAALQDRAAAAVSRLGTNSPRALGAALLSLTPAAYEQRTALLGGVRLLACGRFFEGDEDIYPRLLDAISV